MSVSTHVYELNRATEALIAECRQQIAKARAAELDARQRADKLAQIVQGASGLADAVLVGDTDGARSLATMLTVAVGAMQP